MDYAKAVFLAVIEGITEFLPVSSTGHLIIVEQLVRLSEDIAFNKTFMIIIQLPAILSVVVYFRRDLWPFAGEKQVRHEKLLLWAKVLVAFLPAAFVGLAFGNVVDAIEDELFKAFPVAIALIVGGVVLILMEKQQLTVRMATVAQISFSAAVLIGAFQCIAMVPGASRSAVTIIGAMLLGASRPVAAEFSFFLAIPTMFGATVFIIVRNGLEFTPYQWSLVAVGSVVSFLVAYAVIAAFMNYVRRRDFAVFGYYRIVLALIVLAFFVFAH